MSKFYVRCTKTRDDRFIKGKVYEITSEKGITDEDGYAGHTRGNKGFDAWHRACGWAEYDFELYAPSSYELHITCNDGKTTNAVYKVNGKIEKRTETVCAPSDTFDFATGAELAVNRVLYGTDYNPKDVAFKPIAPQEDKAKFKVGDKVRVVGTSKSRENSHDKTEYVSKILTISSVNPNRHYLSEIHYGTGNVYVFFEDELEPYAEPALTVTREMLVKLGACSDGKDLFNRCFPDGSAPFDAMMLIAKTQGKSFGAESWLTLRKDRIAEMQNEKEPEPVYYSGKVVCTATDGDGTFTVGKVYEFINGQVLDNKSYTRPTGMKMKSLNDAYLANWYYRFIPYLGE